MKSHLLYLLFILISYSLHAQSDPKALQLADEVVEAMGGSDAWDQTHIIQWTFFGRRNWVWDKWTGDVRCDIPSSDTRIAMNINSRQGMVYAHGKQQMHPDSLDKYLDMGYKMWINDSYWLVMPFKMKDPGVTLKYLGKMNDAEGEECDVVEMTFSEVGVTPDNKYHVYISPETSYITQWDYFSKYSDEEPRMTTPWKGYKQYGGIMLSGDRGRSKLENIAVHDEVPEEVFADVVSRLKGF